MRRYMNIIEGALKGANKLNEAPMGDMDDDWTPVEEPVRTKTRTRTRTGSGFQNFADPTTGGAIAPAGRAAPPPAPGRTPRMPAGSTASATRTRQAMRGAQMPAGASTYMSQIMSNPDLNDEISDEDAARNAGYAAGGADTLGTEAIPRTPTTLPAVISQAVMRTDGGDAGVAPFEPDWHMVKNLPGYLSNQIRALGRQVFRPFTDTPIEEIQVLSTLSNSRSEVQQMMAWIARNGIRDDEAEMNFDHIMPGMIGAGELEDMGGYQAKVQVWNTAGFQFMLVHDFAGYYIYGWPGGRGTRIDAPPPRRQLPRR